MKNKLYYKKGFALVSVLFIIAAISLMLGMLIQIGGQRAFTAGKLVDEVKALAYAEAGIDYAYSILSIDFEQRSNASLTAQTSYEDGSFDITLTPVSNKYVIVNSVGKCGDATRAVEILIDDENAGGPQFPDYSNMEGFNYAILSGSTFDFGGTGSMSSPNAKMHSNNSIRIRGNADTQVDISSSGKISTGNVTINGSLTGLPVHPHTHATITGGYTEEPVPPVQIPDIDLTPYFNWADANAEVKVGDFYTSTSYTPAGGVLWVDGDVVIDSGAIIYGSIIATGNITIAGSASISPTTTTFAMASRDGDIKVTSGGKIEGLVYAKTGDYTQTGNGELHGQLIINGTVKKGGVSDTIHYVKSIPTPPWDTTPIPSWPVVAAWQK
ncbi:MAG: hypothetical protein ABFR33_05705 [Verrucomicrobiota bacterium]